jgi:hypothetical protein
VLRSFRLSHTICDTRFLTPIFFLFLGGRSMTLTTWYIGHYLAYCTSLGWWMMMSRGNDWQGKPKYSEKTWLMPLCAPYIQHDMSWDRTRAAAVGSQLLTAWPVWHGFPTAISARKIHCQNIYNTICEWCSVIEKCNEREPFIVTLPRRHTFERKLCFRVNKTVCANGCHVRLLMLPY